MPTFGGQPCSLLKGEAAAKKQRLEIWQTAGIDGYGAQRIGLGESESEFVLVLYSTAAGVQTWVGLIEAMQGTLVTVVNDWSTTVNGFLVQHVSAPQIKAVKEANGATARGELKVKGVVC